MSAVAEPGRRKATQVSAPGPSRQARIALVMIFLAYTVNVQDRMLFSVLQQPIKQEFGLSDAQLGLIGGTAFGLMYALMTLPIARLAERRNRVAIVAATMALFSVMTALTGIATGFIALILCRAGVSAGEAGTLPAGQSLLADLFPPERRITAFSIVSIGGPIGSLLGAASAGLIADHFGWRAAFLALGAPGILLAILMIAIVREPTRGQLDAPSLPAEVMPSLARGIVSLIRIPALPHIVAGMSITFFVSYGVNLFAPVFVARRFEISLSEVGLITGITVGISASIGAFLWGYIADLKGAADQRWRLWVPAICLPLSAMALLIAYSASSLPIFVIFLFAGCLFQASFIGQSFGVATALVDIRMRATVIAVLTIVSNLVGLGLGPLTVGVLSDLAAGWVFAGDYTACSTINADSGAIALACKSASAQGIKYAILCCLLFSFWAAAHYAIAGFKLARPNTP